MMRFFVLALFTFFPFLSVKADELQLSPIASEYPYFIKNSETGEMTLCQIWSLIDLGAFISHYGGERYREDYSDGQGMCKD